MLSVGLNREESRIISIISPLVSILGPLLFAPLADRYATKKGATGKHLRIIAAITMIIGAILYSLLLTVPQLTRFESKRPLVSFACDLNGAILFQERIEEQRTCYHWDSPKVGDFVLTNCTYTCQKPTEFENLYSPWNKGAVYHSDSGQEDYYDEDNPNTKEDVSLV